MTLTMLGTGHAMVTEIYNTCFVIEDEGRCFLTDAGGGNQILGNLKKAGISLDAIHDIFITHKHLDHITGVFWLIRGYLQKMASGRFTGDVRIYSHDEVIGILKDLSLRLFSEKECQFIGTRIHLIPVGDGEKKCIIGHKITFFDIHSEKAKQFGYKLQIDGEKFLTCLGDEPYNRKNECYAKGAFWLLHEAFCLYRDKEIYHPYEKHHSTAREAGENAELLQVKNLILYHTEEENIASRKELYAKEAEEVFRGNVYVPQDFEKIEI